MFKKLKIFLDWFVNNLDEIIDVFEFIKELKKHDKDEVQS